jgi:pyruvate dehydrogenase E2 component (dihydrolipoamide acetyltransferase)
VAIEIVVPRLGWSMDEGTFVEWLKKEGQWVQAGEMLFVIEGDKVTQEIESFDSGFLRVSPAAPQAGDTVAVGQVLGYLVAASEAAPFEVGLRQETQATHERTEQSRSVTSPPLESAAASHIRSQTSGRRSTEGMDQTEKTARPRTDRIAITPRARRAARELRIDWTRVQGTGRHGRIRERDIRAAYG